MSGPVENTRNTPIIIIIIITIIIITKSWSDTEFVSIGQNWEIYSIRNSLPENTENVQRTCHECVKKVFWVTTKKNPTTCVGKINRKEEHTLAIMKEMNWNNYEVTSLNDGGEFNHQ